MPKSWNHAIRRMTNKEITDRQELGYPCTRPKCSGVCAFVITWDQHKRLGTSTGPASRLVCETHGLEFRTTHNLTITESEAS